MHTRWLAIVVAALVTAGALVGGGCSKAAVVTTQRPVTTAAVAETITTSLATTRTQAPTTTKASTTTTMAPTITTASGPLVYSWGSELDLAGVTLQVSEPQADTDLNDAQKLFLADGYGVVYVTVIIKNRSSAPYSYSPMNFLLADTEGQIFAMSTLCSEPRLEPGILQAGRIVKGAVPFEIPEGSRPAYVDYFPAYEGPGTAEDLAATWGY